jgi:hypothetical protein
MPLIWLVLWHKQLTSSPRLDAIYNSFGRVENFRWQRRKALENAKSHYSCGFTGVDRARAHFADALLGAFGPVETRFGRAREFCRFSV